MIYKNGCLHGFYTEWTHNSVDVTIFDGYILWIDCNVAEDGLRTPPCSQCELDALAIDELLEYARLTFDGNLQMWVDAEDSLGLW